MPWTAKLGWLLFLLLIGARLFAGDRIPDDAVTVWLKQRGIYAQTITVSCCVLGGLLLWLAHEQFKLAKLKRTLDALRERLRIPPPR